MQAVTERRAIPVYVGTDICLVAEPPRLIDRRRRMRNRRAEPRGRSSWWKREVAARGSLTGFSHRRRVSGSRTPSTRTSRSGTRRAGSAEGDPRQFRVALNSTLHQGWRGQRRMDAVLEPHARHSHSRVCIQQTTRANDGHVLDRMLQKRRGQEGHLEMVLRLLCPRSFHARHL